MLNFRDNLCYPLKFDPDGRHMFGGPATHRGTTPADSDVPVHLLLNLDLTDPAIPFTSPQLQRLPLYYPLKYGGGGPSMQYAIESDEEIRILYLSDPPDNPEWTCVKVDAFPELPLKAEAPLPNDDALDWFTITLAGKPTLDHGCEPCQNPDCQFFEKVPEVDLLASVPPLEIPGHDEIWYEFSGAYMLFYFWYCRGCQTVITGNRAT